MTRNTRIPNTNKKKIEEKDKEILLLKMTTLSQRKHNVESQETEKKSQRVTLVFVQKSVPEIKSFERM